MQRRHQKVVEEAPLGYHPRTAAKPLGERCAKACI